MPGYAKPPTYNGENISVSPVGTISSTTLQTAIDEIQTELAEAGVNPFFLSFL